MALCRILHILSIGILADLFKSDPNVASKRKNGTIYHKDLVHVWKQFQDHKNFNSLASTFLSILEKFGVCFVVEEDKHKEFLDQRSIIPSLLPEKPPSHLETMKPFREAWPSDPPYNIPVQIERVIKFNIVPDELVSRLLVLIHRFIQNNLVWKNDVVIFKEQENTQAYIRVEKSLSRFIVTIRGFDLIHCQNFLEWIIEQVVTVGDKYKSIVWKQVIRSPHSSTTEISIDDIQKDLSIPLDERQLICHDTNLPILAEKVLQRAGLVHSFLKIKGLFFNFFSFSFFFFSFFLFLFFFFLFFFFSFFLFFFFSFFLFFFFFFFYRYKANKR